VKQRNKNAKTQTHEKPEQTAAQPHDGDRFARYSLLIIVLVATVVFLNMIKDFLVPVILAAVIAGLFFPFYAWLLKRTRGRKSLSSFVCCALLSLGLLLPVFVAANLGAREAVRLGQAWTPGQALKGTLKKGCGRFLCLDASRERAAPHLRRLANKALICSPRLSAVSRNLSDLPRGRFSPCFLLSRCADCWRS
jgi:hypothetical protein